MVRSVNFYCAWFCPYAQRAWMVLKELGVEHKYIEALELVGDGYEKNKRLLHINPKGLVPTLEVFQSEEVKPEVIVESILVMKWLYKNCKGEQIDESKLQEAMEMDKLCCSPFYQVLMTQDKDDKQKAFRKWCEGLERFASSIIDDGFYKSERANILDFTVYPWVHRMLVVEHFSEGELKLDQNGEWARRLTAWRARMEAKTSVTETCAEREKLIGSYSRYWKGTAQSLVGDAVREGKEAHDI